jgi:hypothetical protein
VVDDQSFIRKSWRLEYRIPKKWYQNSHQVALCTSCGASEAKRLVQQKPPKWASGCTRNGQELFAQAKILSSVRCLDVFWVKNSDLSSCFRENLLKNVSHIRHWLSDSCPTLIFPVRISRPTGSQKEGTLRDEEIPQCSLRSLLDFWETFEEIEVP